MRASLLTSITLLMVVSCKTDVSVTQEQNVAPAVQIQSPEDQANFTTVQTIDFQALIADGNGLDDVVSLTWVSNLDGILAEMPDTTPDTQGITRLSTTLSEGIHSITLTATDTEGEIDDASITLVVTEAQTLPIAEISSPTEFQQFSVGADIPLVGAALDPNQDPNTLQTFWTAQPLGGGAVLDLGTVTPSIAGSTTTIWHGATLGGWVVKLRVVDSDGNEATASVAINVADPGDEDADGDGWSPNQGDCDDADVHRSPGLEERCDLVDNDCNQIIDDKDLDSDGHVDEACVGYSAGLPADDCDDDAATTYLGAAEILDGVDNDCNGIPDDGLSEYDEDGDCYCSAATCTGSSNPACTTVEPGDCDDADTALNGDDLDGDGASTCTGDCDDSDASLNPTDGDGDGYSSCTGDCDDADAALNADDEDGDGFTSCDGDCDDIPLACGADCYPSNSTPDSCDNYDQDCDGSFDEDAGIEWFHDADGDGWTSGTDSVFACADPDGIGGEWVSARSSADDCDDTDASKNLDDLDSDSYTTCDLDCDDSVATTYPGAPELCDGVDNNCVNGIDDSEDNDGDGFARCDGDCDDTVSTTHPGATDIPDLNFIDSNCDGIDGDASTSIFVDGQLGNDFNDGSMASPKRTLAAGISASGGAPVLVSSDATYALGSGSLSVQSGVSMYGGYSPGNGWSRSATKAVVTGGVIGATAQGVNAPTTLSLFDIRASSNTAAGGSSYGMRVLDSAGLTLESVRVEGGNGGPGIDGTNGSNGANGGQGNDGDDGCDNCDGSGYGGAGGAGGGSCPAGGTGGRGGYGATGSGGSSGGGVAPGAGGGGGQGHNGNCLWGGCDVGGTGGAGGAASLTGAAGSHGFGGGPAGSVVGDFWVGDDGDDGTAGACGSGGGGGGGGGADDCCITDRGAGGGGGGGAGEGGQPGTAGSAGGGSFGLFLIRSSIILDGVDLFSGAGGPGGSGGQAGSGGAGGGGSTGGGSADDGGAGGSGGSGSGGGMGGHGGGGAGGTSYALYKLSSTRGIGGGGLNFFPGSGGAGGAGQTGVANGSTGASGSEH